MTRGVSSQITEKRDQADDVVSGLPLHLEGGAHQITLHLILIPLLGQIPDLAALKQKFFESVLQRSTLVGIGHLPHLNRDSVNETRKHHQAILPILILTTLIPSPWSIHLLDLHLQYVERVESASLVQSL